MAQRKGKFIVAKSVQLGEKPNTYTVLDVCDSRQESRDKLHKRMGKGELYLRTSEVPPPVKVGDEVIIY